MKHPLSVSILSIAISASASAAQSPTVSRISPNLLAPGKTTSLFIQGKNLNPEAKLWVSFPATVTPKPLPRDEQEAGRIGYAISLLGDFPPGIGAYRITTAAGASALGLLPIDRMDSVPEQNDNYKLESAQTLALPVAVTGSCDELQYDFYRVHLSKGQRLSVDVLAHRIGSELDPVLRLLDSEGRELAYCDDAPGVGADAAITHTARESGDFILEVRDIRYKGGDTYSYLLRATDSVLSSLPFLPIRESNFTSMAHSSVLPTTEIEPNSTPETATPITPPALIQGRFAQAEDRDIYVFTAPKGQQMRFEGQTRSLGSTCDLFMTLLKDDGSVIKEADISGANEGALTHRFEDTDIYRLRVEELNRFGGPDSNYEIQITLAQPDFQLTLDQEKWEAPVEGEFEIKVSCQRRNYDGPITLALQSEESGFQLSDNLIAEKSNEATLRVRLTKTLNPAQLVHFSVRGYAKIEDAFFETQASTGPALKKLFPKMLYPIRELEGLAALAVTRGNELLKEP